jgi:transposase
MEQRMEAVLAAQPVWCLRGVLSDARGMQRDGAFDTVLR